MKKEEILKGFADLSPEDQEAVREELAGGASPEEKEKENGKTDSSAAGCLEMMEKMKAGGDPMSTCKEMMEKMAGKCFSKP